MDPLSTEHVEWLRRQNDRAPNTLIARARVLRSLPNAAEATREDISAWWEARAHLEPATRSADLSHLRGFYKWCAIFYKRADDPTVHIRPVRVNHKVARRAKAADLSALLDGDLPDDLKRAVSLGAYAGLRVSESASLDWADVDDEQDTITVRQSKGGKSRIVDVSPALIDQLGVPCPGSVVKAGDGWYTAAQLQGRLNRAIKALGLNITTHSLRHKWGVAAYQSTGDLLAVSEMMGHSNVQTTAQTYATASSDVKKKIAMAVMR